jgi:hypothetical protein
MDNMNDVNHLDPNDDGLKAIMGGRFHDATEALASVAAAYQPAKKAAPAAKPAAPAKTEKVIDKEAAKQWEPPRPAPNYLDRLKACAKWAVTFGALCCLFFYWQQTGLMAPAAAVPSMLTCMLLAGWGVGRNATK